jgi:hypothetical protein
LWDEEELDDLEDFFELSPPLCEEYSEYSDERGDLGSSDFPDFDFDDTTESFAFFELWLEDPRECKDLLPLPEASS